MWLKVVCGKGTYVRALCRDLGAALGCQACMGTLIRTKAGNFTIEESCLLEDLSDTEAVQRYLIPMDAPLAHLPALRLPEEQARRVKNGNPIVIPPLDVPVGVPLRLYLMGEFCGLGVHNGREVRFLTMLCG